MRIVSLLPSLTELVCDLGCRSELVGVTHECDFPPGIEGLPQLTRSRIPTSASSGKIDAMVTEQGGSLYDLDGDWLASLKPDLILTQEQCDVCAVNEMTVRQVAAALPGQPRVESVNPTDLAGVHAMFRHVGKL
ncbi:TroA family protein, partial [Singulisphaera rosea]